MTMKEPVANRPSSLRQLHVHHEHQFRTKWAVTVTWQGSTITRLVAYVMNDRLPGMYRLPDNTHLRVVCEPS